MNGELWEGLNEFVSMAVRGNSNNIRISPSVLRHRIPISLCHLLELLKQFFYPCGLLTGEVGRLIGILREIEEFDFRRLLIAMRQQFPIAHADGPRPPAPGVTQYSVRESILPSPVRSGPKWSHPTSGRSSADRPASEQKVGVQSVMCSGESSFPGLSFPGQLARVDTRMPPS